MSKASATLEALFVSKVRIKVLRFLLLNPNTKLHLRGIVREIEEEINAVRRELSRLEEVGIVASEEVGSKKFFQVSKDSVFYFELLTMSHKAFGLGGNIIKAKTLLGEVKFALLTEDYLKQNRTGSQKIDLVVIGTINVQKLTEIVEEAEQKLGHEIFYTVFSEREFFLKKKRRDPFVIDIIQQRNVLLVGSYEELIA